jgi:hypothetical protein
MGLKNAAIGIFLLPFCYGFLLSFIDQLISVRTVSYGDLWFLAGVFSYPIFHYFIIKPRLLSTFAHEMTQVLWGLFFRAKVKDIRVRRGSGFVNLSKTNFVIRLAPYFFPFLTILVVFTSFFLHPEYLIFILFMVGFTLSLHLVTTLETLKVRQPDIYKTSIIFSLPFIFLANLFVIIMVLKFASSENIKLTEFIKGGISETLYHFNIWI